MNRYVLAICICALSPLSFAGYPAMNSGTICNGYPEFRGTVTRVNSTTTYDGHEATYIKVINYDTGYVQGGQVFYRDPVAAGYSPMIDNATLALVTGYDVNICYSGNTVYAVEIIRD